MRKLILCGLFVVLLLAGCSGKSSDGGLFAMIESPDTWAKTYEQYQGDSNYVLKEDNGTHVMLTTQKPMRVYGVDIYPTILFSKTKKFDTPCIISFNVGKEGARDNPKLEDFYKNFVSAVIGRYTVTDRKYIQDMHVSDTPCMSLRDILAIPRPEDPKVSNAVCGHLESESLNMSVIYAMTSRGDTFSFSIAPKDGPIRVF